MVRVGPGSKRRFKRFLLGRRLTIGTALPSPFALRSGFGLHSRSGSRSDCPHIGRRSTKERSDPTLEWRRKVGADSDSSLALEWELATAPGIRSVAAALNGSTLGRCSYETCVARLCRIDRAFSWIL